MLLDLYIDTFEKRLVKGLADTSTFKLPALFQGDTVDFNLHFLLPTGSIESPYSAINLANTTIQVAIGETPTGTPGGPAPLALQSAWTNAGDNLSASGSLSLVSASIDNYIGSAASRGAFLEIQTLKGGNYDTVLQAPLLLKAEIIEPGSPAPLPPNTQQSGSGGFQGQPGETITIISPNGQFGAILRVDDSGVFHADNITI